MKRKFKSARSMKENITKVTWQSLNLPRTQKSNSMPNAYPSYLSQNAENRNVHIARTHYTNHN
jgi:hypothetical protein